MPKRPLEGIVIIDFTTMVAGASTTGFLADCGADVIKIESTDGDLMRQAQPQQDGVSLLYALYNAGKKSITLDLKAPAGRKIALDLIQRADVVVENFRPGAMARLGLDYATVSKAHPKLIYCSVSGFGQTGPLSQRPAYAPVAHAFSGFDMMMSRLAVQDAPPPDNRVMSADVLAGVYAFSAIQTALVHRFLHGEGSHVDVTMIEGMMSLAGTYFQTIQRDATYSGRDFPAYKTLDGYVNLPLVSINTYRQAYKAIGREDWLSNPEFLTIAGVKEHGAEIQEAIAQWTATRTSADCDALMTSAGVPSAIYYMPHELFDHPHLVERGSFGTVNTANGSFKVLNPPFKISGVSVEAQPFVADLGADTREVVGRMLGLSEAGLDELAAQKAFG